MLANSYCLCFNIKWSARALNHCPSSQQIRNSINRPNPGSQMWWLKRQLEELEKQNKLMNNSFQLIYPYFTFLFLLNGVSYRTLLFGEWLQFFCLGKWMMHSAATKAVFRLAWVEFHILRACHLVIFPAKRKWKASWKPP